MKVPKGIPSGGINITVVGTNFNYIQDPAIYVLHNNSRHTGKCKVKENVTCCGPAPGSNPQYVENSIYNGWEKRISTAIFYMLPYLKAQCETILCGGRSWRIEKVYVMKGLTKSLSYRDAHAYENL